MASETDKSSVEPEVIWEWAEYRIVRGPNCLGLSPQRAASSGYGSMAWSKMPVARITTDLVRRIADLESQLASKE